MATFLTPFQGTLGSLKIGELGAATPTVTDAITKITYSLSATEVATINFTVVDKGFSMYNRHYFIPGRLVTLNGLQFEIAAVEAKYGATDTVVVTARSKGVQQMRRSKGPRSWGSVSPTQFAASVAAEFGLQFFGEPSPADGEILRVQEEGESESTMDVLVRLANGLKYRVFESTGVLFFASEAHIVAHQPQVSITVNPTDDEALYPLSISARKSVDAKAAATIQASLIKTRSSQLLTPGMGLKIRGLADFGQTFMIDKVFYDLEKAANPVSISGTTVEDPKGVGCTAQTLAQGSFGPCVTRIQQAVGGPQDGLFGKATRNAVIAFQTRHKINPDGVVGAGTWRAIEGL